MVKSEQRIFSFAGFIEKAFRVVPLVIYDVVLILLATLIFNGYGNTSVIVRRRSWLFLLLALA